MPEIKTRQRKNQPVMNTAQQQMQRNFVRSKAEQAAHRQSERSDSPIMRKKKSPGRQRMPFGMGPPWLCGKYARFTKGIMISMVFCRKRICRRNIKRHLQKGLPETVLQHSRKRGGEQR